MSNAKGKKGKGAGKPLGANGWMVEWAWEDNMNNICSYMKKEASRNGGEYFGPVERINWHPYGSASTFTRAGYGLPKKYAKLEDALYDSGRLSKLGQIARVIPWQVSGWARFARAEAEAARSTFSDLPWQDLENFDDIRHAHVDQEDPSKVRFIASEEHGLIWRWTTMKPGRYLKKHFPDLTDDEIEGYVQLFSKVGEIDLRFAFTPDEIEHVYTNGPTSCMAYKARHFDGPCHPARIYGAGDLAVAYIVRGDDRITARRLVWPDKKITHEDGGYGDTARLDAALEREGYTPGSLEGARLLKIECDAGSGTYVMPYLDPGGLPGADVGCKHLFYRQYNGDLHGESTCGVVSLEGSALCSQCEERVYEDDATYVDSVGSVCEPCLENNFVWSDYSEEYIPINDAFHSEIYDEWFSDRVKHLFVTCAQTDELCWRHDATEVRPGVWVYVDYVEDWLDENPEDDDEEEEEDNAVEIAA